MVCTIQSGMRPRLMSYLWRISVRKAPAFPARGTSIHLTTTAGVPLMRCITGGNVKQQWLDLTCGYIGSTEQEDKQCAKLQTQCTGSCVQLFSVGSSWHLLDALGMAISCAVSVPLTW